MPVVARPRVIPGPPRPGRILTRGSVAAQSGLERHEVQGGGALLIPVAAGGMVTVINTEGGQRAELEAADDKGRIAAGLLGAVANSDAGGLKALLSGRPGSGLGGLRPGLERRRIDPHRPVRSGCSNGRRRQAPNSNSPSVARVF